jgi:hypothetical protein
MDLRHSMSCSFKHLDNGRMWPQNVWLASLRREELKMIAMLSVLLFLCLCALFGFIGLGLMRVLCDQEDYE